MTETQKSFVGTYIATGNLELACHSAKIDVEYGKQLLTLPEIQNAIQSTSVDELEDMKAEYFSQTAPMTQEEVMMALTNIAKGSPITRIYEKEGVKNGQKIHEHYSTIETPSVKHRLQALELLQKGYDEGQASTEESIVFVDDIGGKL